MVREQLRMQVPIRTLPPRQRPSSDTLTVPPSGRTWLPSPKPSWKKEFFNTLATLADFEADLIRMHTREGIAIARTKGELRGKRPKLSDRRQRELCLMHATGEYSISDLAELFSVSRPTVYRTLNRGLSP